MTHPIKDERIKKSQIKHKSRSDKNKENTSFLHTSQISRVKTLDLFKTLMEVGKKKVQKVYLRFCNMALPTRLSMNYSQVG